MINPDRHPPDDWDPGPGDSRRRLPFFALPLVLTGIAFDFYSTWVDGDGSVYGTLFALAVLVLAFLFSKLKRKS